MSKVYVVQYDDEDGAHVNWGVDKDGTTSVEVVGCEFYNIGDGGSESDIYNWVQDCLDELGRIGHEPTREQAAQWVCAQVDYFVDEHEFTDEASLRSWQPDKYRLARSQYADQHTAARWATAPKNHQRMQSIVVQLERLLECAKRAAELENDAVYDEYMKEVANA